MPRFHFPAVTFRPAMALSYVLLLMAAELCQLNTSTWWDPLVSIPFNVLFYAAWIWLLFYIVGLLPRCVRMAVHTVLHVTLAAYTVSTAFLVYFFHRHWDAFSLQFVHEANSRETSEFVANYVLSFPTFFLLVMLVAWGAAEWWASRRWGTWPMVPRNRAARMVMGAGCLLMWGQVLFFSPDAYRNYDLVVRFHTPVKRNATWTFWQSVLQYRESQAEFERCALTLKNYDEHVTAEEPEADLVLIIGESFNRHMSNLYDGPYNTNPLLRQREQSGRLFLMKDVISSSNNTTENFKYFLSMASVADPQRWCDAPLLPALLKRAGYRVTYFSNQFAPNDALGEWDASMGYINHPSIEPYIFDRRNTSKYPLDLSLVGDFAQQAQQLMAPKRNFCIFHLYGQHMMASRRIRPRKLRSRLLMSATAMPCPSRADAMPISTLAFPTNSGAKWLIISTPRATTTLWWTVSSAFSTIETPLSSISPTMAKRFTISVRNIAAPTCSPTRLPKLFASNSTCRLWSISLRAMPSSTPNCQRGCAAPPLSAS